MEKIAQYESGKEIVAILDGIIKAMKFDESKFNGAVKAVLQGYSDFLLPHLREKIIDFDNERWLESEEIDNLD